MYRNDIDSHILETMSGTAGMRGPIQTKPSHTELGYTAQGMVSAEDNENEIRFLNAIVYSVQVYSVQLYCQLPVTL